jgi:hypothetical protein
MHHTTKACAYTHSQHMVALLRRPPLLLRGPRRCLHMLAA